MLLNKEDVADRSSGGQSPSTHQRHLVWPRTICFSVRNAPVHDRELSIFTYPAAPQRKFVGLVAISPAGQLGLCEAPHPLEPSCSTPVHCPVSTAVPLVAPLPFSETFCGLLLRWSVTESVPVSVPDVLGEKATLMGQLAEGPASQYSHWSRRSLLWRQSPRYSTSLHRSSST